MLPERLELEVFEQTDPGVRGTGAERTLIFHRWEVGAEIHSTIECPVGSGDAQSRQEIWDLVGPDIVASTA